MSDNHTVSPIYEVFSLRLGQIERPARDNFLMNPGTCEETMGMDFNMWIIRNDDRTVAIDTGFSVEAGERRGRELQYPPREAVKQLGIDLDQVSDLVITHLHYDHAGNLGDFSNAKIWIQQSEIAYVSGPSMRHPELNHFFEADDLCTVLQHSFSGRVKQIDGFHERADGIELYQIGGHTPGLQIVRVRTKRGWVVLASDALHYYANLDQRNPFPGIVNVPEMIDGYELISQLATSPDHIIPGHDPEVRRRYYNPSQKLPEGIAALHQNPSIPSTLEGFI